MKILVVTFFHVPWTATDVAGAQRRFASFLRAFGSLSDDVTLLHLVPPEQIAAAGPADSLDRTQSEFWGVPVKVALAPRRARRTTAWGHYAPGIVDAAARPVLHPFGGPQLAAVLAARLDQAPDLVFAHRLQAMAPIMRSGRRPSRLMLDIDDIDHKIVWRTCTSAPLYPGKLVELLHLPALFALERRAVAASDLAFVCSEADRTHLRRAGFADVVRVVPNAVPRPAAPPGIPDGRVVLFLGDMSHPPNRAAAARMADRIFPRIRAASPGATLLIAGRGSDALPSAGAGLPGVEHLGFVEDLGALYARARVAACPVMTGAGTRLKLVEAAAYARPIVSTRLGAEGLDFADGVHALLRDDDAGFADACALLLRDDAACRRLGAAARRVMEDSYDAASVERRVADMARGLLERPVRR